MIYSTHKNIKLHQINGNIPSTVIIDQQTINPHDLCSQCSKDGTGFLFGKSRIRDCRD